MNAKKISVQNQNLFRGIIAGNLQIVQAAISNGASIHSTDSWQRTPLILAAQLGEEEIGRYLINQGAHVNSKNMYLETALHWAARFGQTDTVKMLIENGADIEARDRSQCTPIHWAIRYGQGKTLIALKQAENLMRSKKKNYSTKPKKEPII